MFHLFILLLRVRDPPEMPAFVLPVVRRPDAGLDGASADQAQPPEKGFGVVAL